MNQVKFLSVALLLISFVILTNGLASAQRDCTHQVVRSDGTKIISTDCTSSYSQTSEITRFPYFSVNNFLNNVNISIQNMQDRFAAIFSSQDISRQIAANNREKEQEALEAQRMQHQEQKIQLENLKEQQEIRKQQQLDLMQARNYNK